MQQTHTRIKFGHWVVLALRALAWALILFAFWILLALPAKAAETRAVQVELGDFIVHQTQQQREGCIDTQLDECWETISQEIEGGRFTPPAIPPRLLKPGLNLLVDTARKKLLLYHQDERGEVSPIEGWVVVTVQPHQLPSDMVEGRIRSVDRNPSWCPTKSARLKYPELPPGCFGPGHELNAMGVAKILIDWKVGAELRASWLARHIHGTGGYDADNFLEDETLGCVRLLNDELLRLLSLSGPAITGARVLLYR